jgi:hypothetical protein
LNEVHAGSVFGHLSSGLEYGPSPFGPSNDAVSFLQSSWVVDDGTNRPNPSDSAKPLCCPARGFSPGAPFRAGTLAHQPDLIHLTLRCRNCLDEWEMDVKPDVLPPRESPHA